MDTARCLQWIQDAPGLIGVMLIDNPYRYNPLIDGLDLLLLAVVERDGRERSVRHVRKEGKRVQIRTVAAAALDEWIAGVESRSIIPWIVRGEILMDRDGYLERVKQRVIDFPEELRRQKLAAEFSAFLRTFLHAKQDLQDGNIMDAHSNVLAALHHWAHISLIEDGVHPELTVWAQMKKYNPGIYKLYEELTTSMESLEKRVQLVLLACEFHVMSKMKSCCRLLLDIIESREEPWSVGELMARPELKPLRLDLSLLLRKLVTRGLIREVAALPEANDPDALELQYAAAR
ncbi:Conserved protein YgxA [Thermobacillus xylanilyticus]|uniref:Conserved protein YgxA n=1 Tax=Thermobacillus xylanilyticus TaxID=76633 RepID=A0ABN7RL92_THEXY|nr:nucleotidyltransferase-like protein [Thermobacillus xylanilyticus]CAG5077375.1 Conserved protein YgxA [Thermobacillus xylanilyticus]